MDKRKIPLIHLQWFALDKDFILEEYCKLFEENKIDSIDIALKLKDNDLLNMGISILGDRIKIISILEKYQKALSNAAATLNNINNGVEVRINKHIFIWIGTFLFGYLGVDRFMRGQIGFGILKLLCDWCYIWGLIDFIIALMKYSKYKEDFIFYDGYWTKG